MLTADLCLFLVFSKSVHSLPLFLRRWLVEAKLLKAGFLCLISVRPSA